MNELHQLEQERQTVQAALDSQKTQAERNRLGQFATPFELACHITEYAITLLPQSAPLRFLDPAVGAGAFFSALRHSASPDRIEAAEGYELDPHYGIPAQGLWSAAGLRVHLADFTRTAAPETDAGRFNLIICNPPYVRHHHLAADEKARLHHLAAQRAGLSLSGLSGLYCYFLALAHGWMRSDGIAAWLIPSEFMGVNYGKAIQHHLLDRVTLLRIHRFDPAEVQFEDALVSSAVLWLRNTAPPPEHQVEFTFGGSVAAPRIARKIPTSLLSQEPKWTRFPLAEGRKANKGVTLGDLFTIRRGIATGGNQFFILSKDRIASLGLPMECFRPILPGPRFLAADEVITDHDGNPAIERSLFLLDCRLPEDEIQTRYPSLWRYLQSGKPDVAGRYLCRHRTPWYAQEDRPPTPFVCTYIGRGDARNGRPFRFILNHSQATAANVYLLLYPKAALAQALARDASLSRKLWQALNQIGAHELLAEGRVYGGGLHKLEPSELAQAPADRILAVLPSQPEPPVQQLSLFE
ncbi:MAG: Eco57I restriction-modification methylase domain-containing protein [Caldilineales bacterium]|nr:Eco57I restriction-modification methylase domain-containing protein [Caldilineales bacterium]MCW5860261.1 Eco57I restriction-modification methylase domain-containing protein [Caldilineales bacterium]